MEVIFVAPVPNKNARTAYAKLRRLNILSQVTKDGIITLSVIVPSKMTTEQTIALIKVALDWSADWQWRHTTFSSIKR